MEIGKIAKKIAENGGRLYLVGGAIRDEILGIETHDRDYCVEKLSEEKFKQLFPKAVQRGKENTEKVIKDLKQLQEKM